MRVSLTRIYLTTSMLLLAALASCGAGSGSAVSVLDGTSQSALPTGDAAVLAGGLPELASLPQPSRAAMLSGPGYFPVPMMEPGVLSARGSGGFVAFLEDGISVDASDGMNFLLFGIHGFDGDSQPNSVMAEVSDVNGEYYIAASHYGSGRWEVSGPFNADNGWEYAEVGPYTDPGQYVSPEGYHYICVIIPQGGSLLLSGLQLGVDGGDNAPQIHPYFEASNGDSGMAFYWQPSTDHNDPDFAGYTVERALWPSTAYEDLGPLSHDTFFHDTTLDPLVKYRFRIRAEDVNGNFSHSTSSITLNFPGDNPPVPAMDYPAGPLHGGQFVTFDMGASFDPDGDAITQYRLSFDDGFISSGVLPHLSATPEITAKLQPGCYNIRLEVTANGVTSHNFYQLKIYPVWDPQPTLVALPDPFGWRIQAPRSLYWAERGEIVTIFEDRLAPGIGVMVEDGSGHRSFQRIPYISDKIDWLSEPVLWNGAVYAAAMNNGSVYLVSYDGNQLAWQDGFFAYSDYDMADLVVDGNGELRACVMDEFNPGDWRIIAVEVLGPGEYIEVLDLSNSDGWFDVEWNSTTGTFDTVHTTVGSIHWKRVDMDGNTVDDEFIAAGLFDFMDLEVDPATGTPALLALSGGLYTYHEYDNGTESFNPLEAIDNSGVNTLWADMVFSGSQATAFFGMSGGPPSLYRRIGGVWHGTATDWSLLSGQHCSLTVLPSADIHIIDGLKGGRTMITDMAPDGSHTPVVEIAATSYQGSDLSAVLGSDGMHAYWRGEAGSRHFISNVDGSVWTESSNKGMSDGVDLMADASGTVWLSNTHGGTSDLWSWFGGAWLIESSWSRWGQGLPFLASCATAPGGQWMVQDNTAVPTQLRYMHDDVGGVIGPDFYDLDSVQLMEGSLLWSRNGIVAITTGSDFGDEVGRVGFLSKDDKQFNQIFQGEYPSFGPDWVRGRLLEGANYMTNHHQSNCAFWTGFGDSSGVGATIVTGFNFNSDFNVTSQMRVGNFEYAPGVSTGLVSVTAAQAWGVTAVGLADQFLGPDANLYWSNYGDFEELDLPPLAMESTSMHELVIGEDGRWYLLYRDLNDGGIYMIHTS